MDLNDTVQITLTKKGVEILNEQNKDFREKFPNAKIKEKYYVEGDIVSSQLHSILHKFSNCFGLGGEKVFSDLKPTSEGKYLVAFSRVFDEKELVSQVMKSSTSVNEEVLEKWRREFYLATGKEYQVISFQKLD